MRHNQFFFNANHTNKKKNIFRVLPAHLGELWNKFKNCNLELNPIRGDQWDVYFIFD